MMELGKEKVEECLATMNCSWKPQSEMGANRGDPYEEFTTKDRSAKGGFRAER
jgi:hypothetical protein